jgi:CheY-like chemotaxis protein
LFAQERATILVVEDHDPVSTALREALEDEGYSVATVAHGEAALDYMRTVGRPDLVLLDLFMPVMDGWKLVSQVRSDPDLVGVPIIVMTAGGAPALARAPVSAGYLSKPIRLDRLFEAIERVLRLSGRPASGVRAVPGAPPEDEALGSDSDSTVH